MSPAWRHRVSAADVRRDYEPLAEQFEDRWQSFHSATRQWVHAHWPEALAEGARMLDVGCGVGGFLAETAARQPAMTLLGVDIVPALIARARRTVPTATFLMADAEDPPFAAESFDVVTSLNILHHLNDPQAHLSALARLARPGGSIFLATFAGRRTFRMRLADWWLKRRNPAWRGMLSPAEMHQLLARQPGLAIAGQAQVKADRWWWLQLYRLDVDEEAAATGSAGVN